MWATATIPRSATWHNSMFNNLHVCKLVPHGTYALAFCHVFVASLLVPKAHNLVGVKCYSYLVLSLVVSCYIFFSSWYIFYPYLIVWLYMNSVLFAEPSNSINITIYDKPKASYKLDSSPGNSDFSI